MTGEELEVAFLRAAMTAGLIVSIDRSRDGEDSAQVEVGHGVALEWSSDRQKPYTLFQHVASDESDGFAGSECEIERFEFLEELLEAAFIRIIQIRLEDVTSEQLRKSEEV